MPYDIEGEYFEESAVHEKYALQEHELSSMQNIKTHLNTEDSEARTNYLDYLNALELKLSSIIRMEERTGVSNPELKQGLQEIRQLIAQLNG